MRKVVASVEARMCASRLPGKMMLDLRGRPVIERVVERVRRATLIDDVIVATTMNPADDVLFDWAQKAGIACYRGSEEDVLSRVVEAQRSMDSDIVVEVCGDTPLIDPDILDLAVATFAANVCDVVSNTARLSFPQGMDAQVFRLGDLVEVAQTVGDPAVREHVSLYFYEHPERYRTFHLMAPPRWAMSHQRLQLDYPEDLELIRAVYDRLEPVYPSGIFGIEEIVTLLKADPALAALNAHCEEKPVR